MKPLVGQTIAFCGLPSWQTTKNDRLPHPSLFVTLLLGIAGGLHAQSTGPTVSPTSLTFTYQMNSATLPAPAKLTATLPATMTGMTISVTSSSAPQGWLTVTPDTGHSPLTLTVTANPTSLTPGSYSGTITVNTTPPSSNPAVVAVTLTISNPPSTLLVSSTSSNYSPAQAGGMPSLTFTYTTGSMSTIPVSSQLDVASNGDIIPFNVTAGGAAGTKPGSVWLRVNQAGQLPNLQTSGVALSGSFVPITVSLDIATLANLEPGSYGAVITIAGEKAANGTATVAVNLIVSAGAPVLRPTFPIFPASVIAGPAVDPVVTIYGDNFFTTSVVAMQMGANPPVTLASKLLSRKVLQATIKAAYLAVPAGPVSYPITWTLSVTNPAPPNNPTQTPATTAFYVSDPGQPAITSVTNAASFLATAVHTGTGPNPVGAGATSISPREIVSVFGQNLGPSNGAPAVPSGTPPRYPTTSNGVQVLFTFGSPPVTVAAPIIVTSANQVNCIVPVEIGSVVGTAAPFATIQVVNGAASTSLFPVIAIASDPGIFTFGGLGQGQGAVLNFDLTTSSYVINGSKAAAPKGSTISIYATGMGNLNPSTPLANGELASSPVTVADNTVRVDIDGQPSVVSYAGTSPGAVAGLVQINAIVPPTVRTGAAIPITVSIGGVAVSRRSQPGVTLAVK